MLVGRWCVWHCWAQFVAVCIFPVFFGVLNFEVLSLSGCVRHVWLSLAEVKPPSVRVRCANWGLTRQISDNPTSSILLPEDLLIECSRQKSAQHESMVLLAGWHYLFKELSVACRRFGSQHAAEETTMVNSTEH